MAYNRIPTINVISHEKEDGSVKFYQAIFYNDTNRPVGFTTSKPFRDQDDLIVYLLSQMNEGVAIVSEFDQATLASLVNGQGTKPEECPDGRMKVKKRYFRAGLIEQ